MGYKAGPTARDGKACISEFLFLMKSFNSLRKDCIVLRFYVRILINVVSLRVHFIMLLFHHSGFH